MIEVYGKCLFGCIDVILLDNGIGVRWEELDILRKRLFMDVYIQEAGRIDGYGGVDVTVVNIGPQWNELANQ